MKNKVFLGGTCNGSEWRDMLIPMLKGEYFNPVVKDWTPACMDNEIRERKECDYVLYVITPKMTGVYSIAEVVDDSNKRPDRTLFLPLSYDDGKHFDVHQWKSVQQVAKMVTLNGGRVFGTLDHVAQFLNGV